MLSAIVIWFMSFNIVMSADKLIYLFGKAAPVLGLTLSMVFRFIPLLQARYREISMGQRCMGRHMTGGFMAKLRQTCKEISILISWPRSKLRIPWRHAVTDCRAERAFIYFICPGPTSCCSARLS